LHSAPKDDDDDDAGGDGGGGDDEFDFEILEEEPEPEPQLPAAAAIAAAVGAAVADPLLAENGGLLKLSPERRAALTAQSQREQASFFPFDRLPSGAEPQPTGAPAALATGFAGLDLLPPDNDLPPPPCLPPPELASLLAEVPAHIDYSAAYRIGMKRLQES